MKRSDAIRHHSQEAASYQRAADNSTGPARPELQELAREHQGLADAARLYEYPEDLDD